MKSILQSIKPQYCELIASGKKTIEVRKTRPKLDAPFKVYIYETKGRYKVFFETANPCITVPNGGKVIPTENGYRVEYFSKGKGKVIGEYVCDKIYQYTTCDFKDGTDIDDETMTRLSCLSKSEIESYELSPGQFGVFAWHISDLKIYDKPKELSEFFGACKQPKGTDCSVCRDNREHTCKSLTHPPQSWCYVEEG